MERRELTAAERAATRDLVIKLCANYDGGYKICLPLDCACYMFGKWWTGGYCRYFKNAVLPNNAALMDALMGGEPIVDKMRPCSVCGMAFPISSNRAAYCPDCSAKTRKQRQREYMRKKRR